MNNSGLKFIINNIEYPCFILFQNDTLIANNKLEKIIKDKFGHFDLYKNNILKFKFFSNMSEVKLFELKYQLKIEKTDEFTLFLFMTNKDNHVHDLLLAIGHEIKTPLSIIRAGIEQIKTEETIKRIINSSVDRISSLSNDLTELEISNWVSLNKIEIELDKVVYDLKQLYGEIFEDKQIVFEAKINGSSNIEMSGGYTVLNKIICPLIDNSINSFNLKNTNFKRVEVIFYNNQGKLRIHIIDNGIGIEKKNIDNVFRPFFKENSERKGFTKGGGLGLAIVKKIVNRLGGQILINSEKNIGSTVEVSL